MYNMASNFWMASLNFALITEMGCCLPVGKHSDGSPTFVTNNAKVVNLRAMIRYGWALRASVFVFYVVCRCSCEKSHFKVVSEYYALHFLCHSNHIFEKICLIYRLTDKLQFLPLL